MILSSAISIILLAAGALPYFLLLAARRSGIRLERLETDDGCWIVMYSGSLRRL